MPHHATHAARPPIVGISARIAKPQKDHAGRLSKTANTVDQHLAQWVASMGLLPFVIPSMHHPTSLTSSPAFSRNARDHEPSAHSLPGIPTAFFKMFILKTHFGGFLLHRRCMPYPCELGTTDLSSVQHGARLLVHAFALRRHERFDTGIRGHVLPSVSHVFHPASEDVDGAHDIRVGLVSAGHAGEFGLRGAIVS